MKFLTHSKLMTILKPDTILRGVLIITGCLSLSSCGTGKKDGRFGGTAYVDVSNEPSTIDVGDATFVTVRVDDIEDDAFFLKIRFPTGLEYLLGSSFIESNGEDFPREPDRSFTNNADRKNYIVYFISKAEIDNEKNTRITFDLVGTSRVSDGRVEVDPDIDNPNIPNEREFDTQNPQLEAEADSFVRVN